MAFQVGRPLLEPMGIYRQTVILQLLQLPLEFLQTFRDQEKHAQLALQP